MTVAVTMGGKTILCATCGNDAVARYYNNQHEQIGMCGNHIQTCCNCSDVVQSQLADGRLVCDNHLVAIVTNKTLDGTEYKQCGYYSDWHPPPQYTEAETKEKTNVYAIKIEHPDNHDNGRLSITCGGSE